MKQGNRVLIRQNARELTDEEAGLVTGSHNTLPVTPCTAPSPAYPNGDGPPIDCAV